MQNNGSESSFNIPTKNDKIQLSFATLGYWVGKGAPGYAYAPRLKRVELNAVSVACSTSPTIPVGRMLVHGRFTYVTGANL